MDWFRNDLRFGWRMLRRTPGVSLVAILTLALGIGANTAIFSVVYSMLLRPLPFPQASQLMALGQAPLHGVDTSHSSSYPNFLDWKRQSHLFQDMGTWCSYPMTLASSGASARVVSGVYASASLFSTLRVAPILGRVFTDAEARSSGARLAVVSERVWRQQLHGARDLAGQTLRINDQNFSVIGVMPASFRFPLDESAPAVWVPESQNQILGPNGDNQRGETILHVVGRLKPGVTLARARAEMDAIGRHMAAQYPKDDGNSTVGVTPLRTLLVGSIRPSLLLLLAAVGCLLLVACVNVASLLLARATGRQQEIAIRAALGAGQGQIMRQLLVESTLLALLGGGAGVLLAALSLRPLLRFSPHLTPGLSQISLSLPVLLFTLLISVGTGLVFGLLPARQVARTSLVEVLNESSRSATGHRRGRVLGALVAAETALALILLVGAALLIQSFWTLMRVPVGWQPDHLLTASVFPPAARYSSDGQLLALSHGILDRAGALPGVKLAAIAATIPLGGARATGDFEIPGRPKAPHQQQIAALNSVSPAFFATMRVPLLHGRFFLPTDTAQAQPVAIISRSLAEKYWPGQNPIGQQIKDGISDATDVPRTIVGVVGDLHWYGRGQNDVPMVYMPFDQVPWPFLSLVVRTRRAPLQESADVRQMLLAIDPTLAPESLHSMNELLSSDVAMPRFQMMLVALFAGITLLLAAVGTAGVVSYSVTQRLREMAIRMALGAAPGRIAGLIVGQTLRMIGAGLVVGVAGYLAVNRLLSHVLFGLQGLQWNMVALAALLLTAVALLAVWLPIRRATRVDPMLVLRE